jgi:hypothetical protein
VALVIRHLIKNVVHFVLRIKPSASSEVAEARCPVNGMTMAEYRGGSRPASYK